MAQGASLLLAMGLWLAVSSVWAGSFQVSPIRLQLSLRERATALHLANTGDTALVLHAEVMHWSQDTQGQDLLEPSNDLVLSPPVVNLPPGGQQVVRLARLAAPDPLRPRSYRLIVRETPGFATEPPPATGQVPFLLAMSLPVFIAPAQPLRQLQCQPEPPPASLVVSCLNEGNVFARVLRVDLGDPARPVARFEGATYVLPGARQRFALQVGAEPVRGPHDLTLWFDDGTTATMAIAMP